MRIPSYLTILLIIDPAMIKVLKSSAYEGTMIATREFEARLKVIHTCCFRTDTTVVREI